MGGRGAHLLSVQIFFHPPDKRLRKRSAATRHVVDVAARLGVMTRVEFVPDLFRAEDVDVRRQRVIHPAAEQFRRRRCLHVEMGDLRHRMDARVGPARSVEFEISYSDSFMNCALNFPLDGARVLLNLPAAVAGACVLDGELESHGRHYPCTAGADGFAYGSTDERTTQTIRSRR